MLVDKERFMLVEEELRKQGVLARFEAENGKILGHMMITFIEIPPEIEIESFSGSVCAFGASFDFYDRIIGIAIDLATGKPVSKVWLTPQVDSAVEPSKEWLEFFLKTLFERLAEDGIGMPIYCFVNDHSDITIVPTINK